MTNTKIFETQDLVNEFFAVEEKRIKNSKGKK